MSFADVPTGAILDDLRQHLSSEERLLAELVRMLSEIRGLLIRKETDDLELSVDEHARILKESEHLARQRTEFLQELAGRFDLLCEDVTLRRIAQSTGGAGQWLLDQCNRLEQLAGEITRLNRQNAAIIVHEADHAREVVRRLTGAEAGDSYDADGMRQDADAGSIFHVDG